MGGIDGQGGNQEAKKTFIISVYCGIARRMTTMEVEEGPIERAVCGTCVWNGVVSEGEKQVRLTASTANNRGPVNVFLFDATVFQCRRGNKIG